MSMSKKDFIALADHLRLEVKPQMEAHINHAFSCTSSTLAPALFEQVCNELADFCQSQNSNFMRDRWLGYIAGTNGKNGGTVKEPKSWAVQGNYGQGWETVCSEDDRKEALIRLREYRENETQYSHRIVRE